MALDRCSNGAGFRLRFEPKFDRAPVIDIPCDTDGNVDLDALNETERTAYFYARAVCHPRYSARVIRIDCS
jgi:hypothetical protein